MVLYTEEESSDERHPIPNVNPHDISKDPLKEVLMFQDTRLWQVSSKALLELSDTHDKREDVSHCACQGLAS